jgi:hypothetical protein
MRGYVASDDLDGAGRRVFTASVAIRDALDKDVGRRP